MSGLSATTNVTTWFLEMQGPSDLRVAPPPARPHRIERVEQPSAAYARYLYATVGRGWHWTERLVWSKARWDAHLSRPELSLITLQVGAEPSGFCELHQQADGDVQLVYFGLVLAVSGAGFGGHLLSRVVQLAWALPGARRIWVHTCTLDAPAALPNYRARGFTCFKTETKPGNVLDTPGPCPTWDEG